MKRIFARDRVWRVQTEADVADGKELLTLLDPEGGDILQILSPPEKYEVLPEEAPEFTQRALSPWKPWFETHQAIRLSSLGNGNYFAAFSAGRISPEPYQFAAVAKLLQSPRPRLLIADDVGLGKTIEAGICLLELMARGRGDRILIIVPPGLIPQWQDELHGKFGLEFTAIENAASLDQVQTKLSQGIKPWVFLNRIITSVEYVKKSEVLRNALEPRWDVIVVDEAHYLGESGTPKNPYLTARARLGHQLRDACRGLILLTATPHNGYGHSFRSLLELVEPTDATFEGSKDVIRRRVSRCMMRRLKPQIYKTGASGEKVPAFSPREPVKAISITNLSEDEKAIFRRVSYERRREFVRRSRPRGRRRIRSISSQAAWKCGETHNNCAHLFPDDASRTDRTGCAAALCVFYRQTIGRGSISRPRCGIHHANASPVSGDPARVA